MPQGPRYKTPRKRRRESRTNYYKRYRMIISGQKVRAVVRKTLNNVIVQIIEFNAYGDKTLVAAYSRELHKYGWLGSLRNTSSAYLTGFLAGLRARAKGIKYAIPDIGLHISVRGSLIYAAIKGLREAGVEVPVSEEVLPSDERVKGKYTVSYALSLLKENPERYRRLFSGVISRGLHPEDLPAHFQEVKEKISEAFKGGS